MTWAADHTQPGYKPDERYGDVTQRDTGHVTVTCHADMSHVTLGDTDLTPVLCYLKALSLLSKTGHRATVLQHKGTKITTKFVNG